MGPQLVDWSHRMVAMYQFGVDRAVEHRAAEAARAFADFVRGLRSRPAMRPWRRSHQPAPYRRRRRRQIARRRAGRDRGSCFLNAGHEATVHAIGNGVKIHARTWRRRRSAFGERERLAATVEELLRLDAPLHLFTRYALEDVEFAGVNLRKGEKIGLLLGAANRDPERFPDPDPSTARGRQMLHVSFGAGIDFCVGAPLARLEPTVALPIFFARLRACVSSSRRAIATCSIFMGSRR